MTPPTSPYRCRAIRSAALAAAALAWIAAGAPAGAHEDDTAHPVLARAMAQVNRDDVRYEATRYLRAGTRSGRHIGWIEVATVSTPAGMRFDILEEGGSGRTRDKVLRKVLQEEADGSRDAARGAISAANYRFEIEEADDRHVRVRLWPKRKDKRLIDGVLTITPEGHPVALEGRLAKSPSFWVRSVTVLTRYERFGQVSLPVAVESVADVKMFGLSSFTMHYAYTQVNGRRVTQDRVADGAAGPSRRILALHASYSGGR